MSHSELIGRLCFAEDDVEQEVVRILDVVSQLAFMPRKSAVGQDGAQAICATFLLIESNGGKLGHCALEHVRLTDRAFASVLDVKE